MRLTEYDDIGEVVAVLFVAMVGLVVGATFAEQRLVAFIQDPAGAGERALSRRAATRRTLVTLMTGLRPAGRVVGALWAVSAAGLAALTVAVVTGGTLRLDAATLPWFTVLDRPGAGHVIARVLVMGGQFWLVGSLVTVTAIWRGIQWRSLRPVLVTSAAMVVMSVSLWVLKVLTGRSAPHSGLNRVLDGGHSYPSGHAAMAVVCLVLAAALAADLGSDAHRWLRWAAFAVAGLVGICTVVLGYHWVSDVLGGWTAGALVATPAVRWLTPGTQQPPEPHQAG